VTWLRALLDWLHGRKYRHAAYRQHLSDWQAAEGIGWMDLPPVQEPKAQRWTA
jgi:hypothetical protein